MISPRTSQPKLRRTLLVLAAGALLWALAASLFVVDVTEFGVVTRFGAVQRVLAQPGLSFKAPFDRAVKLEQRVVFSEPKKAEYLSLDKKNIVVESLATWRIGDPQRYFETLHERASADARLADTLAAEIGAVLGRYPAAALISAEPASNRYRAMVAEIRDSVARFARAAYGVEVIEVALTRLSLPERNRVNVFERMKAERGKIAMEYRSAGELESKRIIAEADREKSRIEWDAYAEAQRLRAEGDAEASRVYTEAFAQDAKFYKFLRTLQAYEKILDPSTTLFLPAGAEVFEMLRPQDKALAPQSATTTVRKNAGTAPLASPKREGKASTAASAADIDKAPARTP